MYIWHGLKCFTGIILCGFVGEFISCCAVGLVATLTSKVCSFPPSIKQLEFLRSAFSYIEVVPFCCWRCLCVCSVSAISTVDISLSSILLQQLAVRPAPTFKYAIRDRYSKHRPTVSSPLSCTLQ